MATRSKSSADKSPTRRSSAKKTVKRPAGKRTAASPKESNAKRTAASKADGTSKQSRLIGLLRSDAGATLDQMVQLTGWQPHTVRGTVSGVLRKRLGLNVTSQAPGAAAGHYKSAIWSSTTRESVDPLALDPKG